MKKAIIILITTVVIIIISLFIYNSYKTKRIEYIIGANQHRLEQYLNYPNDYIIIEKIDIHDASERIEDIINDRKIAATKPILRYTMTGAVRKQIFWLIDQGEGYYVIDAIDTNK